MALQCPADGASSYGYFGWGGGSLPAIVALTPSSTGYTTSFWYKSITNTTSNKRYIFVIVYDTSWTLDLVGVTFGGWGFGLSSANVEYGINAPPVGRWQHWVFSRSTAGAELWIDGVLEASTSSDSAPAGVVYDWAYSQDGDGAGYFPQGALDGVSIWNRPLTSSEARVESKSRLLVPVVGRSLHGTFMLQAVDKPLIAIAGKFAGDAMEFPCTTSDGYKSYGAGPLWRPANLDYLPDAAQFARPIADIRTGNWKAI